LFRGQCAFWNDVKASRRRVQQEVFFRLVKSNKVLPFNIRRPTVPLPVNAAIVPQHCSRSLGAWLFQKLISRSPPGRCPHQQDPEPGQKEEWGQIAPDFGVRPQDCTQQTYREKCKNCEDDYPKKPLPQDRAVSVRDERVKEVSLRKLVGHFHGDGLWQKAIDCTTGHVPLHPQRNVGQCSGSIASAPFHSATILPSMKHVGENVVRIEADALRALADRLAGPMAADFHRAVDLLFNCPGRVVVTGMGKSGIIARKIAATLNSTGSPALYLHPVEALHGDLGVVVRGDVVLALSASGETEEILRLLATIKRLQVPLISMTCDEVMLPATSTPTSTAAGGGARSTLAAASDIALDCSISKEACSLGLAPTASTTTMLALGDALAVALSEKRGFKEEDFANLHPGGKLGKRLARVESLMHSGDALPRVDATTKMPDVIYEMSRKKLGVTTVVDGDQLLGVISDGDLRRLLERRGKDALDLSAQDCMNRTPKTIDPQEFAATALARMEEMKITSLVVVDDRRCVRGIVHLHDLWGTEMV
jgi:arabinose-5-phosphate isomerase